VIVFRKILTNDLYLLQKAYIHTGDEYYFEKIFKRFEYFLKKYVSMFTYDPFEREDLFQEASIGFWKTLKRESPNEGYLVKRLVWKAKTAVRDNFKRKEEYFTNSSETVKNDYDFEKNLEVTEFFIALRKILNPHQNYILDMYLEGYTQTEISKKFGVSISAINDTMKRIRDKGKEIYYE